MVYGQLIVFDINGDTGILAIREKNAQVVRYDLNQYGHAPFKLLARDVVNPAFPIRHDTQKLAEALVEVLNGK